MIGMWSKSIYFTNAESFTGEEIEKLVKRYRSVALTDRQTATRMAFPGRF
jgi:hypothetical protein